MQGDTEIQSSALNGMVEFEKILENDFFTAKPGELVKGEVVGIVDESVIVDIGYKSEGYIHINQFESKDGEYDVKVGDEVEVLMLSSESDSGEIIISRERAQQLKTWLSLEEAFEKEENVEGEVVQKVKGGLQVDIGVPAFLPGSQVDVRPQRNLGKFVGETIKFRILKINKERGNIVLSRRVVIEDERKALKEDTITHLEEGVVLEGIIKNVTDYGAFIDLGGIDGLLHITDISWGRVNHPREVLNVGDTVPVVVLKYDEEKERVSLGRKQLQPNPWNQIAEKYKEGDKVNGEVVTLTDYGAFIKLEEDVEGLIHVSHMSWSKKVKKPSKLLKIGQEVEAVVLEVNPDQQRISLGLKQLQENPWEELAKDYVAGTKIKGKIRSIMDFGIFINVKDDIDGLVHLSEISWSGKFKNSKDIQKVYKKGDEVEAVVLEIEPETERLSLGIKQLTPDVWETVPSKYQSGAGVKGKVSSITDFGLFIELEEGVEGLLHISGAGVKNIEELKAKYTVGSEIQTDVVSVDTQSRRISLALEGKGAKVAKTDANYAKYMEEDSDVVTFGDLIQQQLDEDK